MQTYRRVDPVSGEPTRTRIARLFGICMAVVILNIGGIFAILVFEADGGDTLTALFPPWWSSAQSFGAASAAGSVVRVGAAPWILLVRSEQRGLASRLRSAGAALVMPPYGAGFCHSRTIKDESRA